LFFFKYKSGLLHGYKMKMSLVFYKSSKDWVFSQAVSCSGHYCADHHKSPEVGGCCGWYRDSVTWLRTCLHGDALLKE